MTKLFEEFTKKARAEFDAHVRPEIRERAADPRPIKLDEWRASRMNSWERQTLYHKLDDATLAEVTRHSLANSSHHEAIDEKSLCLHGGTYDSLVMQVLVPIMLRRIEVMHREIAACADLVEDYEVCKRLRAAIGLGAP